MKTTLPLFLEQMRFGGGKLIVVDFGDPDGSFDYCRALGDPNLAAMRVLDNTERFNVSRARNCGVNLLPCDIAGLVDSDSLIHPKLTELGTAKIRSGHAVVTRRNLRDWLSNTFGLCFVRTDVYHRIRGYDEQFEGWGLEDADLFRRAKRMGPVMPFPVWLYPTALPHSNAERTRFNVIKDIGKSAESGIPLFSRPEREVNTNGYGRARALVFIPGVTKEPQLWNISEPPGR